MKKYILYMCAVILALTAGLSGCKKADSLDTEMETETPSETVTETSDDEIAELTENHIDALIRLTNGDEIEIELYPDLAPKTVANFIKNVQENFYAGTIFHRAIDGFVVQGGGYDVDYQPKTVSETVVGEFERNGYENPLSHERGILSMARVPSQNDSATTQFFIVQDDSKHLDGEYAAFGKVKKGMIVVDTIAKTPLMEDPPAGMQDVPEQQYVIETIEIDTADE